MGPWVRYPTKQLIVFRQNHNGLNLRMEESWEAGHPHFGGPRVTAPASVDKVRSQFLFLRQKQHQAGRR
jgi:hypothetical protein